MDIIMKEQELKNGVSSDLVDIRDITVDRNLPIEERIKSYVRQVKNPYDFRVGEIKVHVSYSGGPKTLNDSFTDMIRSL